MEKKTVLENLDLVLLVMDETVDGGWAALSPSWLYLSQNAAVLVLLDNRQPLLRYFCKRWPCCA